MPERPDSRSGTGLCPALAGLTFRSVAVPGNHCRTQAASGFVEPFRALLPALCNGASGFRLPSSVSALRRREGRTREVPPVMQHVDRAYAHGAPPFARGTLPKRHLDCACLRRARPPASGKVPVSQCKPPCVNMQPQFGWNSRRISRINCEICNDFTASMATGLWIPAFAGMAEEGGMRREQRREGTMGDRPL